MRGVLGGHRERETSPGAQGAGDVHSARWYDGCQGNDGYGREQGQRDESRWFLKRVGRLCLLERRMSCQKQADLCALLSS